MKKFRFSLISLLMIPAAFAVGWWLGARTQKERVDRLEQDYAMKVQAAERVAHALQAAVWINRAYYLADTQSPQEQLSRREHMLILEILDLALAEEFGKENQAHAFVSNADAALDLLHVSSYEEFQEKVKHVIQAKDYQAKFLNPKNKDYPVITKFLHRVFAQREAEPRYPARVWIKAIFDDDADLLRSAYSTKLQQSTESWEERLQAYQQKIQGDLGATSPYEFGFPYSASDPDGEVEVYWKDQQVRTIKIIHEDDGWKLDEF